MQRPSFLIPNQTPIWVLVTGNVRSGSEFKEIFRQVLDLRDQGLVDGIRFATWKNDLDHSVGLATSLAELGISTVAIESPKADPKVHPLFHGYVYHQRKSLHFGLKSLPADCFVLKARTDFAEERFDSMIRTLFGNQSQDLHVDLIEPILKTRLFSYDARTDYLFYWDDIVFSGMRDDLLGLNNFDLACEFIYPEHFFPAEVRLFAPLFLKKYPVLDWFFENVHGEKFAELLQRWSTVDNRLPLPILIRAVLAAYFHILSRYIVLPKGVSSCVGDLALADFFRPADELGVKSFPAPWPSHKLIFSTLLDQIRDLKAFGDPELEILFTAVRRMDSDLAARGAMPANLDSAYKEFKQFAESFDLDLLVPQYQLILPVAGGGGGRLEKLHLPEKRHLSRWEGKKLGLKRAAAQWALRKLL